MSSEESSLDHHRLEHDDDSSVVAQSTKCCNKRIGFAYVLSFLANFLVVAGVLEAYRKHDPRYLLLPAVGVVLILFGSCFYRSGWSALHRHAPVYLRNRRQKRRNVRQSQLFSSQLSLNMLPQCFTTAPSRLLNSSSLSSSTGPGSSRYLMLPLESNTLPLETTSTQASDRNKSQVMIEHLSHEQTHHHQHIVSPSSSHGELVAVEDSCASRASQSALAHNLSFGSLYELECMPSLAPPSYEEVILSASHPRDNVLHHAHTLTL